MDNKAENDKTVPSTGHVDWNAAWVLVRVVQDGSFRSAARSLGLPKSTVSRKVAELEAQLGAHLLQRTTRAIARSA